MTLTELAHSYAFALDSVPHATTCYISNDCSCTCDRALRQGELVRRAVEAAHGWGRHAAFVYPHDDVELIAEKAHAAALTVRPEPST